MKPPLYLSIEGDPKRSPHLTVRLATCRNCGKPKLTSRPCSFDHLAAILEFNARTTPAPAAVPSEGEDGR